ncbi:AAA family ATPase [Planktothrix pseudagardhii]|uniref:Chromosome segregation protein SMC n=1 Tax=Planktothrix pseudagardhii TaxID=132604 RepID=A0A9W4CU39_9CYAN|nr:AAA family ATPase [Planktothrix pseudagardhii]CAD5988467.1 Chromosome segregation protein SMC [Planktothrix pseudagardhii]
MFKKITLKNYRTHKSTTLELKPITLLIGNNSSGKTNFLSGIQHFSGLIKQGNPFKEQNRTVQAKDYFSHRYRLASEEDTMSIEIEWSKNNHFVRYYLELYQNEKFLEKVGCREKLEFAVNLSENLQTLTNGYEPETDSIEMRLNLEKSEILGNEEKELLNLFFKDCENIFSYHLQPSFLKGIIHDNLEIDNILNQEIKIPAVLGNEGKNLQKLIYYIKTKEERVYSRFLALMRRFADNRNFVGIRLNERKSKLLWEFDLGRTTTDRLLDEFPPEVISDGLLKAAAIALLVSIKNPPALMLMEEIENGINPGNIQELIGWIWQATAPNQKDISPQFILTSHSPSVLREFHQNLDSVYTFRLNKRNYQSDVRNLNQALDTLIGIGTVEGDIIEDEKTGNRRVEIPKYQLAELWYSGTIG